MNTVYAMKRLMIIADDFTGALDTGVKFSSFDAETRFILNPESDFSVHRDEVDVAIVNSDTRHLSPQKAYQVVYDISRRAQACGFSYIYKKVDSGLRGNIGSELSAVMDATDNPSLHFIPAYPKQRRITKGGYQFIDGILLKDSIFSTDPLNPPLSSSVEQIVSSQSSKEIIMNDSAGLGIHIYDASTDKDMAIIAEKIGCENIKASAGCAGFAPYLAKLLGYDFQKKKIPTTSKPLLVVSGSVNPVTQMQIRKAADYGVKRYSISSEQKTNQTWIHSSAYRSFIANSLCSIRTDGSVIIDIGDEGCISPENTDISMYVVSLLAKIVNDLFLSGLDAHIFTIGGDTLKAIADCFEIHEIQPVSELQPGVVLNKAAYGNMEIMLVSKSGGFGDENTVVDVINHIKLRRFL